MTICDCSDLLGVKVSGCCYYHAKVAAHLVGDRYALLEPPSTEQLGFIGLSVDLRGGGGWEPIADPLARLLAELPVEPWERHAGAPGWDQA